MSTKSKVLTPKTNNALTQLTKLLQQAQAHIAAGDHGSALRVYREALALAPDNAGAAFSLAVFLNRVGKSDEALQWLKRLQNSVGKLRTQESATMRAGIWAQTGLAYQQEGQLQLALDAFGAAYKLTPTPELNQVVAQLQPLVRSPLPVQQLILHARTQAERQQYDHAFQTYTAALQLHPDNALALHGLAMVQRQRGHLAEALPLLQKAIVLLPDRPDFFNDLGMIFQDRGEFLQAVSFHKRALKLNPSFTWAMLNLGVAHKRLGNKEDALAAYQNVLRLQPTIPEVHNNLGNLLRTMGRHAEARTSLLQALTLRPNYPDAQANLQALDAEIAVTEAEKNKALKPSPAVKTKAKLAVPAANVDAKKTVNKAPVKDTAKLTAKAPIPKSSATKAPVSKKVAIKKVAASALPTAPKAKKTTKEKPLVKGSARKAKGMP
ncbi:MAG: hypothetical protein CFE39_05410 [Comamonadaceae bacterium PBBC2]|nr:MAG: hypothetical protein CFE39_05410 [Comamonadaceae bacterium PBBC2]